MRRTTVSLTVTALAAALGAVAAPQVVGATTPTFSFAKTPLGQTGNYGEPSIAVAPDSRHVVVSTPGSTPDGGGVQYWYSADNGKTFKTTFTTSANGGGDSELEFLPNGSLLSADLEITDSNVKRSTDFGKTWDAGREVGVEQDRQWFAHSPDGKTVYLVYHDFAAEAEFFARSTDGGRTWPKADAANPVNSPNQAAAPGMASTPKQGDPASFIDQGGNTFSGPILVGPTGRDLYVLYSISDLGSNALPPTPPYGPSRGIVVAHSADAGATWTNKYAVVDTLQPPATNAPKNGAIFPWGSVDRAGNVYVFYNSDKGSLGHFHMYYVWSGNKGATWSKPIKVDNTPMQAGEQIYATGAAGKRGVIDLAWYSAPQAASTDDPNATWYVKFAQVRDATNARPIIYRSQVSTTPIHHGSICLQGLLCITGGDRSLADFFELAIGPDGMARMAYADNHLGRNNGQVVYARQSTGLSAYK